MYIPKYIKGTNLLSFKEFEFHFRNDETVIIQGRNLDDLSQKGNGSGKSSLIEIIALAASGKSIRDVLTKDLIHNDEKYGEVEWYLENPVINKTLKIYRKIYSGSKSAECRIWINGVEKTDIPDINEYNKVFFDQLGISKDDFFNFFLITDENGFVPFLKASDTKKKEIINRFSGADRVDGVFPLIEADSAKKQQEISQIDTQLVGIRSKMEVLVGQQIAEEEKINPENQKEAIFNIENEIRNLEGSIEIRRHTIKNKELEANQKQSEVDNWKYSKDYPALYEKALLEKNEFDAEAEDLKKQLAGCKDLFAGEIEEVRKEEQGYVDQKATLRNSINEYQQFIDDVKNKTASSIECPSCGHKFNLQDKTFNVTEALATLPEAEKELEELKQQYEKCEQDHQALGDKKLAINQKVLNEQNKIKDKSFAAIQNSGAKAKEMQQIESDMNSEDGKLNLLKSEIKFLLSEINNEKVAISGFEQQIQNYNTDIDKLRNVDRTKIDELEKQTLTLIDQEAELVDRLEKLTLEKAEIDAWIINFKNFKSHLANKSIRHIQDYTNMFLGYIGSNISIEMDGYRLLSSKKLKEEITTTVKKDGFHVGVYGKFSRGERGRVDICNVLANQELINLNSPTGGVDLLLADEVLDAVDTLGLEHIVNAFQSVGKTIMIVSQNEINSLPKHTIVIEKKNKVSKICQ